MTLAAGGRLGRFELLALLGRGGMGEVWRARDPRLSREVALKVLPANLAEDPEWVARFEREGRALAALNHPNVAQVFEVDELTGDGTEAPLRVIVMELVEGETLRDRIRDRALTAPDAIGVGVQIARALVAAHSRGVIHRDLKPANVMLTPDGVVKVLDFGLARLEQTAEGNRDVEVTMALSKPGMVLGTASYMAPEQMRGEPCDERCDVWALGCCLGEMLTGRRVFGGATVPEIVSKVLAGSADTAPLTAAAPREVRRLIERSLAFDRDERPSMAEVERVLDTLVRRPDAFRWPWLRAIGLAVAFAAVAIVVALWLTHRLESQPAGPGPLRVAVASTLSPGAPGAQDAGALVDAVTAELARRPSVEVVGKGTADLRVEVGPGASVRLADTPTGRLLGAVEPGAGSADPSGEATLVADQVEREAIARSLDREDPLHGFLVRRTGSIAAARAFQIAVGLYGRRRLVDAEKALDQAVAADPTFWPAHAYLALVDGSRSRFADAQREIAAARAALTHPDAGEATLLEVVQATVDEDLGRLSEALKRARDAFPGSGELTYRAAWTWRQLGKPDRAVPLLQQLIRTQWQPDWSPTWVQLAYCQLLAGSTVQARETAVDGEARFPREESFSYIAAVAARIAGDEADARADLDRAIRKRLDYSSSDRLATYQTIAYWCANLDRGELRQKYLSLCLDEIEAREKQRPDDADLVVARADALVGLGRLAEARRLLEPLAGSDDPYALISLGRARAGVVGELAAGEALERAGELWRSWTGPARGTLAYNIACAWAAIGDRRQAMTWLQRARELHGFDRIDLLLDPDLARLRQAGYLAPLGAEATAPSVR